MGKQTLKRHLFKPHLASSAASRKPNGVFSFKQKMSERKAVKFYRSYWEIAMELTDKDRLAFYDAIMLRQFTGQQTELSGMAKFAYISQKHSIDAQVKGFEDKTNTPLVAPSVGGTQPPLVQVQEKEKEKVEYTIEERKLKFANTLKPFLDLYGKETLNEFYAYWTEHSPKAKKLRFELERAWGIERRLINWNKNKNKFNNFGDDSEPKELLLARKLGLC